MTLGLTTSKPGAALRNGKADETLDFNSLTLKELSALSSREGWDLGGEELSEIQAHFRSAARQPTPAEVETLARFWSAQALRGVLDGPIRLTEGRKTRLVKNVLDVALREGALRFGKGGKWALVFAVDEGIGAAVREVLAAGLGAKPVLGADVLFVAPPDSSRPCPEAALRSQRALREAVAGVRGYANRLGLPTAAGGVWFDPDYRRGALVLTGAVGVAPARPLKAEARPGDLIVAAGERTGREPCGARAASHALGQKRLQDALLRARDRELYRAVAACGTSGFAGAVARLAAGLGARVRLEEAKLKTPGLEPRAIWLSESPERVILAVAPKQLKAVEEAFAAEGCETSVLGEFTRTGRLAATFREETLVDLDLKFLREGRPKVQRTASWDQPKASPKSAAAVSFKKTAGDILRECLAHWNVCSREILIRQYDHEAQGGTVIKPLQGVRHDGPGDACVIWPQAATLDMEDFSGFAMSHGFNPAYGKADPYRMAMACADEALRNLLCAGADVSRAALAANVCGPRPDDAAKRGALVRAAEGLRDAAEGFGAGFTAVKTGASPEALAQTLLVTAVAPVLDVRKALTMDIKGPGNALYLVGWTSEELGGSLFNEIVRLSGGAVPEVEVRSAAETFRGVQAAIAKGLVLSAHDLSEGGLAVAAAEMAFSGEFGLSLDLDQTARSSDIFSNEVLLFSESPSRVLLEVKPEDEAPLLKALKGVPVKRVGLSMANPILKVRGLDGSVIMEEPLAGLKAAWQRTLPEALA